jgi:lipopolysaccharide/colanic/teichoic acid biosynthesis glycosyltransferase/protein involved in polysaccharide export with SLBB domain
LRWRVWRSLQQVTAGLTLILITPLIMVLFLLVKLDSRGPFLYTQERPGHLGRRFAARKIRTMTVGADRNPMLARAVTSASPEVTRVGRLLRDLKLDELPQLWNVLRGDMVFVGPRPIAPGLQDFLESSIPGFATRLSVPPGLTSLGQVCIEENESVDHVVEDWTVRFEAERHYLAHRSVTYDLVIIGMTIAYCVRKVLRRLPLPGMTHAARRSALLSAPLALLLGGCAETLERGSFAAVDDNVIARPVPWQEGAPAAPVIEHETVSVDTLPRGEHDPVYRLGAGDRLEINIFGEPGMEALVVQVDGAGDIQLPMLDNVEAAGLSLGELQIRLKERYGTHFMDPWVVVQLREPLSRPIYLLGEFNQPGIVHMTSETTLIQALGAGRGLTERAYTRGSRLIRDDKVVAVDINALLNRGRMDQNVWLQPNDTIFVPGLDDLRIFVLGAIAAPGALEVTNGPLTLADAITRSGGPRRGEANLKEVRIIRSHSPVSGELFVVDFTRITQGLALDMPLEPGDIVYLPVNGMGGWNDVIEAISPTILTISRALDPFVLAKTITDS